MKAPVRGGAALKAPDSSASIAKDASESQAYHQGQADRLAWETWFNDQSGDFRSGAEYWAAHRSLPTPGSCSIAPAESGPDWSKGCFAAQARLAAADVRRKTEPNYRLGWNNPPPVPTPQMASTEPSNREDGKPDESPPSSNSSTSEGVVSHIAPQSAASEAQPNRETQEVLVRIVNDYATKYENAPNEMLQGAMRPERRDAICAQFPSPEVGDWVGTLSRLSSNNDGDGVLVVTIAPNVTIKTWNNSFSDIGDHTLIPHGSRLFLEAAALHEDEKVVFSGAFITNQSDCFKEGSLTVSGAMTEPEFLFRFSAIRPWTEDDGTNAASK